MKITKQLIESGKTGRGGWTKEQLGLIGVSWPPVTGWIDRVIGKEISAHDAEKFVSIGRAHQS